MTAAVGAPPSGEGPQLRPLGVGDIVDRVLSLYRARPLLFLALATVPYLALFLVVGALSLLVAGSFVTLAGLADDIASGDRTSLGAFFAAMGSLTGYLVAVILVALVFLSVQTTAIVDAMSQRYLGRATDVGASFRRGLAAAPRVIGTGLALFIALCVLWLVLTIVMVVSNQVLVVLAAIVIGLFATVYALVSALVAPIVATVEGAGPIGALRRAWTLSEGNRWRILGLQLLLGILNTVISVLLSTLFLAGLVSDVVLQGILQQVANVVATVAWAPIQWGTFTVLYYDLRVRREAFDLQLAAEALPRAP